MDNADQHPNDDAPVAGSVRGNALIDALNRRATELNMSMAEVAEKIDLSYTYYSALMSGRRPISSMKSENFRTVAAFLRTSVVQVLIWAEVILPEDFYYPDTLADSLDVSYAKILRDPEWGSIIPPAAVWKDLPLQAQLALVLLYEKVSNKRLLERAKTGKLLPENYGDTVPAPHQRVA